MNILSDPDRRLKLLLRLVSLHSAVVGAGLILHPPAIFARMGYAQLTEPFFSVQGGVFHIVMAIGYAMAAADLDRNICLVRFSIVVKTVATAFLLLYWLLIDRVIVVLTSGLLDGAMAALIGLAYVTRGRPPRSEGP